MQKTWLVKIPENTTIYSKKALLNKLPISFLDRANRYIKDEDSYAYILGRLLLKKALVDNELPLSLLEKIQYSIHGKPSFIDCNFSISHSNRYVAFVFSTKFSIGIDIEKKKKVDLKLFEYLFTSEEWSAIMQSKNALEKFYWYWVRKEALLKAAGCGLGDLMKLEVFESHGTYMGRRYYFEPLNFDLAYNGIVAIMEKKSLDLVLLDIRDLY